MDGAADAWKKCSACKKPIPFGSVYWVCSVSTCNRKRVALWFCSVPCWDAHLPIMSHRRAWAEERRAPRKGEAEDPEPAVAPRAPARPAEPAKPKPIDPIKPPSPAKKESPMEKEVLVVASKIKGYVREKSGMNTSASVLEAISERIRAMCDAAIETAKSDGRKTVMDRDFK